MEEIEEQFAPLQLGDEKNMVAQILLFNVGAFVLLFFTQIIYVMEGNPNARFTAEVLQHVTLQADPAQLLHSPWTLITSLFIHNSVLMIFSNMLWFWFFGSLLQQQAGHRHIVPLYLFSGLAGSLFYLLAMQFIPQFHYMQFFAYMTGASAPIMAMAIGSTLMTPNHRILRAIGGGIPLWVITVIYIVISIGTLLFSQRDLTYLPAMIGGGLMGYIYMAQWKSGRNLGAGLNKVLYKVTHLFHPPSDTAVH
jgi:membrane associated rhomboid family serine protease